MAPARSGAAARATTRTGTRLWLVVALAAFALAACIDDDPIDENAAAVDSPFLPTSSTAAPGTDMTGARDGDDGSDSGEAASAPGELAPVEIVGEFVEGPCPFSPPVDAGPRCGTVTVPMDWSAGTGSVALAVAVYPSTAADPAPDPVIYLDGGPGSHALDSTPIGATQLLDPLRARGDVVVFDQRGAGRSEPRLDCPELTALSRDLEDRPNVDRDEAGSLATDALAACRDRLTADGVDLAAFTTVNNAHDVEAIRVALGYEQWNLLGISYGTRLGLEVLRQHPDGVRTAVLDSVFPPQVDSTLENPATFLASFEAVVAACRAEPECAAAGDLGQRLAALAQRLEANPLPVEVINLLTAETDEVLVDGDTVVGVVNQALYSPTAFGDLPELVAELERGETAAASAYLSQQRTTEELFTTGMFFAIICNDEIAFADRAAVEAALPADPYGLQDRFDYSSNSGTGAFASCDAFAPDRATPPPPIANEPVTSDVPALVMAGRFDPVTPVSWSEASAETLSRSHLVVDPNNSHGVSPGRCGMAIVTAFLDDPDSRPDTSCFDEADVAFLAPVDPAVTLEPATVTTSSGRELAIVRPADWIHGGLPGDSYRQASFLDPTQIIQLADNPAFKLGIELYLDQQFGVALGPSEPAGSIGGRDWQRRVGTAGETAVEWYETEIDGAGVVVALVSTAAELEVNIDSVLRPALEGIDLK